MGISFSNCFDRSEHVEQKREEKSNRMVLKSDPNK